MPTLKVLVFAGSLRTGSFNRRLAALAATRLSGMDTEVDHADFAEWPLPIYDGDLEAAGGIPAEAADFGRRLSEADAMVIASPEYNNSVPGGLKNLIDWASRMKPQPFARKQVLLLSASPSMVGGNRGLWALRIPLEHLGARVYPEMFSLAQAHQSLTAEGTIADQELGNRFDLLIRDFLALVEASVVYPCAKQRWVEFLGEKPDPLLDRIEVALN